MKGWMSTFSVAIFHALTKRCILVNMSELPSFGLVQLGEINS